MFSTLQLQYFITVAEEKSFSGAAKILFLSQQTLSIHIAQMEKEIGAPLFIRTRPLSLTDVGASLLVRAKEIMQINNLMRRELKELTAPTHNTIRVGFSHAHARTSLTSILNLFLKKCPEATVKVVELNFESMGDALNERKIDLALTRPGYLRTRTRDIPISEYDDLYLYAPMPALKRIYGDKAESIRDELKRNPSIHIIKDAPFTIPSAGSIHDILLYYLAEENITPDIRYESTSLETSIALSMSGYGISAGPGRLLLPKVMKESGEKTSLEAGCYLLKKHVESYALSISMLADTPMLYVTREFINATRQYFDELKQKY